MNILPNRKLLDLVTEAFSCQHFGECREAIFKPEVGHVPRGFLGATGSLEQVQAIFVLAEPGHPLKGQSYSTTSRQESLEESIEHTYRCFRDGENLLHKNVRGVMSTIWPNLKFDEQLRHVWITESRLCSIEREIGGFRDRICSPTHLVPQIRLMPSAVVIAFGNKAKDRIMQCRDIAARQTHYCRALAPPGCNRKDALESWQTAAAGVREKFNLSSH